jgi:hypothetical protein
MFFRPPWRKAAADDARAPVGAPPSASENQSLFEASINIAERAMGMDMDGDGDVGERGVQPPPPPPPPPGVYGRTRAFLKRHAKRFAKAVAFDELRTWLREHQPLVITLLAAFVLSYAFACLLVKDFDSKSSSILVGYTTLGVGCGVGGVALGILSVSEDDNATKEARQAATRNCLPMRLREVLRTIFLSATIGGLTGGLLSGALALLLFSILKVEAASVLMLGVMLSWNLLVLTVLAVRNHVKTRGTGGWAQAHKVWSRENDWTAVRALL